MISNFETVQALLATEIVSVVKGIASKTMSAQSAIEIVEPQPVDENDLQFVDAGERDRNWRVTWTATEIETGDEIEYQGKKYRVVQVNDRSAFGFYRVVMREKTGRVA